MPGLMFGKDRVISTDEWKATHAPCLTATEALHPSSVFRREPSPHPSGEWIVLVCPCGARHTTLKDDDQ